MTIYPNDSYTVQFYIKPSSSEGQSLLLLGSEPKVIGLPAYNDIYSLRGLYTYPQIEGIAGGMYSYYIFNNSELPDIQGITTSSLLDKYFTNNSLNILAKGLAIFEAEADNIITPSLSDNNEFIYPTE